MNIVLIGFSTTGKSTFLDEIKKEVSNTIKLFDSDSEISRDYDNHIYNLYLNNYDNTDPINRKRIMGIIAEKENLFISNLLGMSEAYIAALGPNIHIRENWTDYYKTAKPYTIFLKSDLETVYEGLVRREDELSNSTAEFSSSPAFGNWNLGVIRDYNHDTKRYERMPKNRAIDHISKLLKVNEEYYSRIADLTVEATLLFEWHKNFNQSKKRELIEIVKKNIG